MNAMLEAYRNSCNQLTIRISELSQQIQQTCSQTEADCLNHRKHLLPNRTLGITPGYAGHAALCKGECA